MDPRQLGPIAIVVDSSGRPVLNDSGEPIGVYRQEVSARQRKLNERLGKGRNIVWSSNSAGGDDYPYTRSAVVERFHLQACRNKEIGPGFRLTEYGREMVAHCASRPSVVEPPDPAASGSGTSKERRRARRAAEAMIRRNHGIDITDEEVDEIIASAPDGISPITPENPVGYVNEPADVLWTDRELFERLSESPAERAERLSRAARVERRIARDRALDEIIDPILDRIHAREEAAREKRRARAKRKKARS